MHHSSLQSQFPDQGLNWSNGNERQSLTTGSPRELPHIVYFLTQRSALRVCGPKILNCPFIGQWSKGVQHSCKKERRRALNTERILLSKNGKRGLYHATFLRRRKVSTGKCACICSFLQKATQEG